MSGSIGEAGEADEAGEAGDPDIHDGSARQSSRTDRGS
jgi:hypothetical protein